MPPCLLVRELHPPRLGVGLLPLIEAPDARGEGHADAVDEARVLVGGARERERVVARLRRLQLGRRARDVDEERKKVRQVRGEVRGGEGGEGLGEFEDGRCDLCGSSAGAAGWEEALCGGSRARSFDT